MSTIAPKIIQEPTKSNNTVLLKNKTKIITFPYKDKQLASKINQKEEELPLIKITGGYKLIYLAIIPLFFTYAILIPYSLILAKTPIYTALSYGLAGSLAVFVISIKLPFHYCFKIDKKNNKFTYYSIPNFKYKNFPLDKIDNITVEKDKKDISTLYIYIEGEKRKVCSMLTNKIQNVHNSIVSFLEMTL